MPPFPFAPSPGKSFRIRRIADPATGRFVMIPMDHGVSNGPLEGLVDPAASASAADRGGATSVIVHKGLVPAVGASLRAAGLVVHLSASTALNPDPNDKRLVCTVDEAIALGADAISVHVNVGAPTESRMVEDLGAIARDCVRAGMPLLAMMYPRGHDIADPHDVKYVKHVARLGAELGADVVKCPYTGSIETFREVVQGCPVPVVISGGPKAGSDEAFLRMVADAMRAGAAGVSVGRNAFAHAKPEAMVRAIAEIVLKGASPADVRKLL
ncbi:MAG TPA: 2-amino-3,7-dideoxy-D-threo-hept-6-ulosonate synthase [Candidatus Thermoplasmatota archaeon]|nr:2-amino-3,7-dideoxy-D-threo-hept-6-ulosonate synthase [Candidatus Thermoplasmatota archaeon]